jgi:broad specificity phosphatase PhoE
MNLYVTRHGQTDGNLYRIMDGIRDIDLNEDGNLQILGLKNCEVKMYKV